MFDSLPAGFEECLVDSYERSFTNLHDGEFVLKDKGNSITLSGTVAIQWAPNSQITVAGTIVSASEGVDLIGIIQSGRMLQMHSNDRYFGLVQLVSLGGNEVHGRLDEQLEEPDVDIEYITFHLLNSKKIANHCAKTFGLNGSEWSLCRLYNENFEIDIQHYSGYDQAFRVLTRAGGFEPTHFGKVKKKDGTMTVDESNQIIKCLNSFISFVNGKKIGLVGIKKYKTDGNVWQNLLGYQTDWYMSVRRCIPDPLRVKEDFLNELWGRFYKSWFNEQQSENVRLLVQLYVESNINLVYIENCLILSQTAIELAANLKFCDKTFDTTAAKIRALLKEFAVSHDIPNALKELKALKKINLIGRDGKHKKINDGPDCITEIRNSVIHPETWGRENLNKISTSMRVDTWLLANWYVELCILNFIDYQGLYKNRLITGSAAVEKVPWAI